MQSKLIVQVPKLPNIAGVKPPRDLRMWSAEGVVVNSNGYGVEGIVVEFFDLHTGAEVAHSISESGGFFRNFLPPNNAGYKAQPCAGGKYDLYCPAFFNFTGNSPLMRFTAMQQQTPEATNKVQSK